MQRILTEPMFYNGITFQGEIYKNDLGLIEDIIVLVNGQPVEFVDDVSPQQADRLLQIIMQKHQGELAG